MTLPKEYADEIKLLTNSSRRGFESIRVDAVIGKSTWQTSIFPDSASGSYLLPITKKVRDDNLLKAGDRCDIELSVIDTEL